MSRAGRGAGDAGGDATTTGDGQADEGVTSEAQAHRVGHPGGWAEKQQTQKQKQKKKKRRGWRCPSACCGRAAAGGGGGAGRRAWARAAQAEEAGRAWARGEKGGAGEGDEGVKEARQRLVM